MTTGQSRLGLLLAALLCVTTLQGGPGDSDEIGTLTIFYTSDIIGNFDPCGCKGNPTGGLARRAGVMERYRRAHGNEAIVQIDLGNLFSLPGPQSILANQLLVESLSQLPIEVINLTPHDLRQWKKLTDERDRFVSANLQPRRPGDPTPRPFGVVTVPARAGGLKRDFRIAFIGLTDPAKVKPNSGYKGLDPIQSLARVKEEARRSADLLVLLTDLPRTSSQLDPQGLLYRLAEGNPEIDAIFNTEGRYVLFPPRIVNKAVVVSGVERGRQLGRLTFTLDSSARPSEVDHEFYELKEGVIEDPIWKKKQDGVRGLIDR